MDFIFLFDRMLETALHDATLDPSSDNMDFLREAMQQTNNTRNLYEIACLHPQQDICLQCFCQAENPPPIIIEKSPT